MMIAVFENRGENVRCHFGASMAMRRFFAILFSVRLCFALA